MKSAAPPAVRDKGEGGSGVWFGVVLVWAACVWRGRVFGLVWRCVGAWLGAGVGRAGRVCAFGFSREGWLSASGLAERALL